MSLHFEMWDPFNTSIDFIITKSTILLYIITLLPEIDIFLRFKEHKKVLFPIIFYFILLTIISYLNINSQARNYFDFPLFLNIIIFLLVTNHFKRNNELINKGLAAFAIGGIILTIFYYLGIEIDTSNQGRISIFGDNENGIGIKLSFTLLILTSYIFYQGYNWGTYKYLLLFSFPFLMIFLAKTGSRVSFFSFFIGVIAFILLTKSNDYKKTSLKFLIGLISLVAIWKFFSNNDVFAERLMSTITTVDISGRDIIWELLSPVFLNNIFFGVGITGYAYQSEQIFNSYLSPHNVLMESLCYTGIIGTAFFILFIITLMRITYMNRSNSDILPIILWIPIVGLILSGHLFEVKVVWVLFAYMIAQKSSALKIDNFEMQKKQ